ncbi:hypothetical protein F2Q69_00022843 [Brassica cretica]|uniref:Uncharacterized protein n=1 Tax=Brassica cretica TaxID=69181 RepID=A0A8S9QNE9_BRACR|nr:hypothetical protein F2Q69_00022843 [Brassica cretica]
MDHGKTKSRSSGVVTASLPYWFAKSRCWSVLGADRPGVYFVQPAVTQTSLWHALLRSSLRRLVSLSGVSSVLCEFPLGLIQSVGHGAIGGLLAVSFVD